MNLFSGYKQFGMVLDLVVTFVQIHKKINNTTVKSSMYNESRNNLYSTARNILVTERRMYIMGNCVWDFMKNRDGTCFIPVGYRLI